MRYPLTYKQRGMNIPMITGLIITGVFMALILYLGFRDWHNSKLPDNEAPYVKYSSP